ncbi:hypothetical protein L9F63_003755, partial [Diploptera punctata]
KMLEMLSSRTRAMGSPGLDNEHKILKSQPVVLISVMIFVVNNRTPLRVYLILYEPVVSNLVTRSWIVDLEGADVSSCRTIKLVLIFPPMCLPSLMIFQLFLVSFYLLLNLILQSFFSIITSVVLMIQSINYLKGDLGLNKTLKFVFSEWDIEFHPYHLNM